MDSDSRAEELEALLAERTAERDKALEALTWSTGEILALRSRLSRWQHHFEMACNCRRKAQAARREAEAQLERARADTRRAVRLYNDFKICYERLKHREIAKKGTEDDLYDFYCGRGGEFERGS